MREMTRFRSLRLPAVLLRRRRRVAEKLKEALVGSVLGLQVVGTFCPPFREMTPAEDRAVVDAINAARPHIVWWD